MSIKRKIIHYKKGWRDKLGRFVSKKTVHKEYMRRYKKGKAKRIRVKGKWRKKTVIKFEIIPTKMMYRMVLSIDYIPLHYDYYSFMLYAWELTEKELYDKENELKEQLHKGLEKALGYTQRECDMVGWSFSWEANKDIGEVPYDKELIKHVDMVNELVLKQKGIRHRNGYRSHHKERRY